MRPSVLALSLVVAAGLGCGPSGEQAKKAFRGQVALYFDNLNNENLERKDGLRAGELAGGKNPALPPPAGMIYSTFLHDASGFVVANYPCQVCEARLLLAVPSLEYLCRGCGHNPFKDHGTRPDLRVSPCNLCVGTDHKVRAPEESAVSPDRFATLRDKGVSVRPMFELTQESASKPLVAKVRYVRRSWAFDARATVQVLERLREDPKWFAAEGVKAEQNAKTGRVDVPLNAQGFHRLDGVYVGEIEFEFRGGALRARGPAAEEPVRPWKDSRTAR